MMRSFAKLVYAQVVLGIVAYGVAEQNAAMVLVGGAVSMLSWYIVEGPNGWAAPRWFINTGVIGVTLWLFYAQIRLGEPMLHSLGKFILFIQLFKLYERKANRDYAQLIVLSLLQMVCAAIISAAIIFGLMLVVYLVLALFTVLVYQIKISHDEVYESTAAAAPAGQHVPRPAPVVSRGYGRHFRFLAMLCGLGALFISAVVFLFLPRGQGSGMLGEWQPKEKKAASGFNNQVRLAGGMQITASPAPVMHLVVTKDGQPIGSAQRSFLLRGAVMDIYDRKQSRWHRDRFMQQRDMPVRFPQEHGMGLLASDPAPPLPPAPPPAQGEGRRRRRLPEPLPHHERPEHKGHVLVQHVSMRAPTRSYLFGIWPPVAMQSPDHNMFHFNADDQALTSRSLGDRNIDYTVYSLEYPTPDLLGAYQRQASISMFGGDPLDAEYARAQVLDAEATARIRQLTQSVITGAGLDARDPEARVTEDDDRIAHLIEAHLQKEYAYTLELPQIPARTDPILAFLFQTRMGHCEFFASSMVAMLRSVGITARVVNGFRATEFNTVGNYYIVRERNAHAWVESWSPQGLWKSYDPSPPEVVEQLHRGGRGFIAYMRDLYEYLEYQWITNVITFDATQRRQVMQNIDQGANTLASGASEWFKKFWEWLKEFPRQWILGPLGYTLIAIMSIVIVIGVGLLSVTLYRRWRLVQQLQLQGLSGRQRRRLAASLVFYLQLLDLARKAGHEKPLWQTPAAFAQHLHTTEPQRFAAAVPLTDIFYEIRFGNRPMDTTRFRRVTELLEQLKAALPGRSEAAK